MRGLWGIVYMFLTLAACGDPLAGVVVPDGAAPTALPTQEELDRETSILAGLFRKRATAEDSRPPLAVPLPKIGAEAGSSPEPPPAPDAETVDAGTTDAPAPLAQRTRTRRKGVRDFHVTGVSDGCARQFTAALAIFGSPRCHEQLRHGLPAREYPYSTTDKACETVKAGICNVGRTKRCGPRIARLDDTTVFISVYEHFGDTARRGDMLLHDGVLLATAVKTP